MVVVVFAVSKQKPETHGTVWLRLSYSFSPHALRMFQIVAVPLVWVLEQEDRRSPSESNQS